MFLMEPGVSLREGILNSEVSESFEKFENFSEKIVNFQYT